MNKLLITLISAFMLVLTISVLHNWNNYPKILLTIKGNKAFIEIPYRNSVHIGFTEKNNSILLNQKFSSGAKFLNLKTLESKLIFITDDYPMLGNKDEITDKVIIREAIARILFNKDVKTSKFLKM